MSLKSVNKPIMEVARFTALYYWNDRLATGCEYDYSHTLLCAVKVAAIGRSSIRDTRCF